LCCGRVDEAGPSHQRLGSGGFDPEPLAHLAATAQEDAVTHMRQLFQKTMEAEFTTAIERLTGAKVVAFISGNNVSPDVASELFILDVSLT
jgi:uncharacterized protein YbcI